MPANIELKARYDTLDDARCILTRIGAELKGRRNQVDEYLAVPEGTLKIRQVDGDTPQLIHYRRLNSPLLRESTYSKYLMKEQALHTFLRSALGSVVAVEKTRETFRHRACLIHLDEVSNLGSFLEIEAEIENAKSPRDAEDQASTLAKHLSISPADIIPWSYSDLLLLTQSARTRREQLRRSLHSHCVILVDGASGTGKSTLLNAVADHNASLEIVPRLTTRKPRPNAEEDQTHMRFVPACEFRRLVYSGELLEYRDFLFGMSYGLPWEPIANALHLSKIPIGLINLGNGPHIKYFFPEAVTVLIDAPIDDVERRLNARKVHTKQQVQERLDNARRAQQYGQAYDYVVSNEEGKLATSIDSLRAIIERHMVMQA